MRRQVEKLVDSVRRGSEPALNSNSNTASKRKLRLSSRSATYDIDRSYALTNELE